MTDPSEPKIRFLASVHPYDTLPAEELQALAQEFETSEIAGGGQIYRAGERLDGLYLIASGAVSVTDAAGEPISLLGPRNSFGERGLMRDGLALTNAEAAEPTRLLVLPADRFRAVIEAHPAFRRFFTRSRGADAAPRPADIATLRVDRLMTRDPLRVTEETPLREAARLMTERHVSSLCVTREERLAGILTLRDIARAMGEGCAPETKVAAVMTPAPLALPPGAIGSDVLQLMLERRIGHVPVVENGRLVGIVTQTDLTRQQALSTAELVGRIAEAPDAAAIAETTARLPRLLAQLMGTGHRHEIVTRLVTDIADAATRRLLALAEAELGAPPVPYLWLACGSQGRQEQSGVSDQDNCLIIDDAANADDLPYFDRLAQRVTAGLDAAGYVFCPGEMMASTPRWRQPLATWRSYFAQWIATPSPGAQMLASVMFDLRPIAGDARLFADLQAETLAMAQANSIFVAHMASNALKHTPPLGLLRGFATVRSGEHRRMIDLKHSGVVPVVDLGRIYALQGRLAPVNTRARLEAAGAAGIISARGTRDLLDAYDLIAETRLAYQARQIRAGEAPGNFMPPSALSDFERSHLRDAFVVVRTMQSALAQNRGALV